MVSKLFNLCFWAQQCWTASFFTSATVVCLFVFSSLFFFFKHSNSTLVCCFVLFAFRLSAVAFSDFVKEHVKCLERLYFFVVVVVVAVVFFCLFVFNGRFDSFLLLLLLTPESSFFFFFLIEEKTAYIVGWIRVKQKETQTHKHSSRNKKKLSERFFFPLSFLRSFFFFFEKSLWEWRDSIFSTPSPVASMNL